MMCVLSNLYVLIRRLEVQRKRKSEREAKERQGASMYVSLIRANAKKARTYIVQVKSTASPHSMVMMRDKLVDKYEFVWRNPLIDRNVLYKEQKKLLTIDNPYNCRSIRS